MTQLGRAPRFRTRTGPLRRAKVVLAGAMLGLATGAIGTEPHNPAQTRPALDIGRAIYLEGLRADGSPVQAFRAHGLVTTGRESACVQCHRPSGQGGAEGDLAVPPITGEALRRAGTEPPRLGRVSAGMRRAPSGSQARPAYDESALARALSQGVRPDGSPLDPWMPRYALNEQEVQSLWAYLDALREKSPRGFDGNTLHLAIIEPQVAQPEILAASTDVLNRCLNSRSPAPSTSETAPPSWQVHRWTLGHDPTTWPEELARRQASQPVFAVISGLSGTDGNGDWAPIHAFCERSETPCVLPLTAVVDDRRPSHWSLYFSGGVSLEAAVAAQWLNDAPPSKTNPRTWRQIVQDHNPAAALAAERLREHLKPTGWSESPDPTRTPAAEVLWLDSAHLIAHARQHPPPGGVHPVLVSGELLGYTLSALPIAWQRRVTMIHGADPQDRHLRRIALNAGRWLAEEGLSPSEDPRLLRLQGHSYTACEVARNALLRMGRRIDRQYFLELLESAEDAALATAYPRFTLGPGQRHGAKGAWMVRRVKTPRGERLQPVSEWITPP